MKNIVYFVALFLATYCNADDSVLGGIIYPEVRGTQSRLEHCQNDMNMDRCALRYGFGLKINDVFDTIASTPELISLYCNGDKMQKCLRTCAREFRASKYGYMYSMCLVSRDLVQQQRCWTPSFPEDARRCYSYHYPSYRARSFYPIPIRAYDLDSIARDCFPDDEEHCQQYKSLVLWNLMPTYYEMHTHPVAFRRG